MAPLRYVNACDPELRVSTASHKGQQNTPFRSKSLRRGEGIDPGRIISVVRSQSLSSFSAFSFAWGEGGFQVLETRSKRSSTASILGRFSGRVAQHKFNVLHKSSVNQALSAPSGILGCSPSRTFRMTITSLEGKAQTSIRSHTSFKSPCIMA